MLLGVQVISWDPAMVIVDCSRAWICSNVSVVLLPYCAGGFNGGCGPEFRFEL